MVARTSSSDLVADLLAASSSTPVAPTRTLLSTVIEGATAEICDLAMLNEVELGWDPQSDAPLVVDAAWIVRALRQLISNAVEACGPGGRTTLRWGLMSRDQLDADFPRYRGAAAFVQVHDNGPGVPCENEEKIFKPFFSTRPKRAGLGLAIARDVAEVHGGVLRFVRSTRGGATFELDLPSHERNPCWESNDAACRGQQCDACAVRQTGTGYCCWVVRAQGMHVETGRWPASCQQCRQFRASNLAYFYRRTDSGVVGT